MPPAGTTSRRASTSPGVSGLGRRSGDADHRAEPWAKVGRSRRTEATPAAASTERSRRRPEDERDDGADDCNPRGPRGTALLEGVAEVARELPLQDQAADERERRRERAEQRGDDAHAAARRRSRAVGSPRGAGPARARPTSENGVKSQGTSVIAKTASDPPDDVGRPAPPRRERGERDQQQRRDGDRARPTEHLRREREVVDRAVQLAGVLSERALALGRVRG